MFLEGGLSLTTKRQVCLPSWELLIREGRTKGGIILRLLAQDAGFKVLEQHVSGILR